MVWGYFAETVLIERLESVVQLEFAAKIKLAVVIWFLFVMSNVIVWRAVIIA
jgi:hypothetical protein